MNNELVTSEYLISLGFRKQKRYDKIKSGVSVYEWNYHNCLFLSMEKHHCGFYDEGEVFYPTLRIENTVFVFKYKYELYLLLNLYKIKY